MKITKIDEEHRIPFENPGPESSFAIADKILKSLLIKMRQIKV